MGRRWASRSQRRCGGSIPTTTSSTCSIGCSRTKQCWMRFAPAWTRSASRATGMCRWTLSCSGVPPTSSIEPVASAPVRVHHKGSTGSGWVHECGWSYTRRVRILSLSLLLSFISLMPAVGQKPMPLWPGTPPGKPNVPGGEQERDTTQPTDTQIAGKRVQRISFVSQPTLTLYPAPTTKNTGATVVVFPGGAYRMLAYDLEGTEVCEWLNSIGVNCALVKYRVPNAGPFPQHTEDLADAQRAVRIVRQHASAWQLNPKRIGVLGFSAGGHLVA